MMDAGRALDARVASRVMGLTLAMSDKAWSDEDWLASDYPTEENVLAIVTDAERGSITPLRRVIPHYSTSIAAAWEVRERMRELGYRLILTDDLIGSDVTVMFVGGGKGASASAPTAAEAICRAALKAVGANDA